MQSKLLSTKNLNFLIERVNSISYKKKLIITAFIIVIVILIYRWCECGFEYDTCYWRNWTGFGEFTSTNENYTKGKTLWDLLDLLIVPILLAFGAWWLNKSQEQNKQRIENDRQKQTALENYFDKMSELLLKENLRKDESSEARTIARTRTLSVMQIMDSNRKAQAIQFIQESDLITNENVIIDLLGLDLRNANLENASLKNVKIAGADFSTANLNNAILINANLTGSIFVNSNFEDAKLTNTNLEQAILKDIDFKNSDFEDSVVTAVIFDGSDLSSVNNFTQEMLDKVGSCLDTKLPKGLKWKY